MNKAEPSPSTPSNHSKEKTSFFTRILQKIGLAKKASPSPLKDRLKNELHTKTDSKNGHLGYEDQTLLQNILNLREARIEQVMMPRSRIEAVESNASLEQVLYVFERSGHSRLPIYEGTLDNPRGMIHIRDVLNYLAKQAQKTKKNRNQELCCFDLSLPLSQLDIVRTVLFVPASMRAQQLLTRMQNTRTQLALIVDEFGGIDGLVSMEDIVELIVGDIEDEHDDNENMIRQEPEQTWLIDARAELEDVEKALQAPLSERKQAKDIDTIGGLIVTLLERIPNKGEMLDILEGYQLRILEADKKHIKRIRLKKKAAL